MIESDVQKRFDRIVAILVQLQSKRIVKAHELAERFGVSLRTIYRDIKTLGSSGIPIYSEAGIGYSLMEGYRLPPLMFTKEEAASFVAADKLMQKFTDAAMQAHFSSALYKLKAILRSNDKDWVSIIDAHVLMQPTSEKFNEKVPDALAILFESIARKTQIRFIYKSVEAKATERVIEPVGVFHQDSYWYSIAYCHLREAYRQFRIDRIEQIYQTDLPFKLVHQPLESYLQTTDLTPKTTVRILVDNDVVHYLKWERHYHGFIEEETLKDKTVMTFEVKDIENGFVRWFLMFADKAEILEPPQLKDSLRELLESNLRKINSL